MSAFNEIKLIGRITKIKESSNLNGRFFDVAINTNFINKEGQKVEKSRFFFCQIFGEYKTKRFDELAKVGANVIISGELDYFEKDGKQSVFINVNGFGIC